VGIFFRFADPKRCRLDILLTFAISPSAIATQYSFLVIADDVESPRSPNNTEIRKHTRLAHSNGVDLEVERQGMTKAEYSFRRSLVLNIMQAS